jgi:hypothetical protein
MLIAFDKKRASEIDVVPSSDEVLQTIRNFKLRKDNSDVLNPSSSFDADFFDIVFAQFVRYNLKTKQLFLLHI